MNDHQLTWYMQEVAMHAHGVRIDLTQMHVLLANHETRQSRLVWFHLASLLAHAGMISKLVSPIPRTPVATERGARLKEALGIDPASEVLARNARDNTEHFDERLDNWVSSGATTILEIVLPGRDAYNYFRRDGVRVRRVLLLEEQRFISENRDGSTFELEIGPLVDEVARIGEVAMKWIDETSPYHFINP